MKNGLVSLFVRGLPIGVYFSILLNKAYDILYVMKNIEIKTSRYHALNETERTSIDRFVHLCWGEQEEGSVHRNDFPVQSFGLFIHGTMTAYAGVILIDTMIDKQRLLVGALSCFCVHPSYRHHGYGSLLFDHLTKRIVERSQIDLGLFTCAEQVCPFYLLQGSWQCANWNIYADNDEGYQSKEMGLTVLVLSVSPRCHQTLRIEKSLDLHLHLPDGMFI